jgi:hypothetical protein
MAKTILELYKDTEKLNWNSGNPDASIVDGYKNKDKTPYTVGVDFSGTKDADDKALAAFEKASPVAGGNRYVMGPIGGGSSNLSRGWSDAKPYGKQDRAK